MSRCERNFIRRRRNRRLGIHPSPLKICDILLSRNLLLYFDGIIMVWCFSVLLIEDCESPEQALEVVREVFQQLDEVSVAFLWEDRGAEATLYNLTSLVLLINFDLCSNGVDILLMWNVHWITIWGSRGSHDVDVSPKHENNTMVYPLNIRSNAVISLLIS